MKILSQGAEALLYLHKDKLVKERISKSYRIKEIDIARRKYPTRNEAKLLGKTSDLIFVPKIFNFDDEKMKIEMEFIDGKILRDVLDKLTCAHYKKIGEQIAVLHNNNIIHGDLTTSNMILKNKKIYFIDFGLGFISDKIEDKAVDLHLLKQVLSAKHYNISDKVFKATLEGYKNKSNSFNEVLKRLEKVDTRGRYKRKVLPNVK